MDNTIKDIFSSKYITNRFSYILLSIDFLIYLHFHIDPITCVTFDALGEYVLVSGDKHIKIFCNVTGYRAAITSAKYKLKQRQTSATRERLEKIITDAKRFLEEMGEECSERH